jgi:DNA gyrase subunit A
MFATAHGSVRRNRLSDFANIRANGLIAMKLDEGERLIGVETCREDQDVLLFTRQGKCIRFKVSDVRVFSSRASSGVRGIRLAAGDEVLGMTILDHVEIDAATRRAYAKRGSLVRRGEDLEEDEPAIDEVAGEEAGAEEIVLEDSVFLVMKAREQFLLSVANDGFGKRTSAYEYRVTGRGGKGIDNLELGRGPTKPRAEVVAAFPVEDGDQIVLISDGGQIIRSSVDEIRFTGRKSRGVTIFRVAEDEKVVSVAHIEEEDGDDGEAVEIGGDGAENGSGE